MLPAAIPPGFWVPLVALMPFLIAAAWTDFSRMTIPNRLVLLAGAAVLLSSAVLPLPEFGLRILSAGITFAMCCALFAGRLLGGGDTKFFPVVMLAVPAAASGPFLVLFGLSLGVTLIGLSAGRHALADPDARAVSLRPGRDIPMGVSMALAVFALITCAVTGWI